MENLTSHPGFISSASDGSTFNSADCDSGAQDMFGDSLSLNELRKAYPELYHFMCKTESNFDDANLTEGQEEFTWSKMENYPKEEDPDVAQIFKTSDSVTSLLTIRKAMSSIFECLNTVHVQKTSKLRLEIRDLCCRLQGLQASREMDQREIYRLQRENDRYRRELSQQASRYEERITELHGVLAELKRKAAEIQAPTSIGNGTVGVVDDLAEFTDSESEADKANGVDGFVQSDLSVPLSPLQPTVSENVLEHLGRQVASQDPWVAASVRTVKSAEMESAATGAATSHIDVSIAGDLSAASVSGTPQESRALGKPIMGLRLHNQTRRPRILSQSSGGSNWIRRNSVQCNHTFQPTSEFSLNFDPAEQGDRLSKASSCDDRTRQSNSPVLSSSTSSVSQSCRSGDNFTSVGLKETEEPQWVRNCMSRCAGEGSGVAPSCTSAFVQTFLGGLAGAAPYQRLADFARCALLACEQREAACARQEAELTVLEASLAEAKAAGDQLQCRLGQIEASWGAAARAAELADMALETSGVLVHLYSSELALFLHKQPNSGGRSKSEKLHHPRSFARLSLSGSTFTSSSTSSTSSSASSDEDEHQGLNKAARSPLVTPNSRRVNSSTKCTVCQTAQPAISSDSGNNVYAVYAINGKLSDEGSTMPSSSWILPHTTCNGPACIRLLRMQRSQAEMVATNLLARFSSMPEPFFKPESLTFTAAEDFDPCTANCNRSTTAGTESGLGVESGGSSSGLGVCGMYANAWHTVGRPSGSTGQSFKSYGGWQTPDSGAGSCSTNDHTAATALVTSAPRPNAHSCSSHSSNSSSTAGVTSSAVFGGAGEWNRVKEFKLRHILDQIIWERMLVRNTIAVGPGDFDGVFSAVPQGGDYHNTKPYMRNEMFSYCEGRENGMATQDSKEPVISSRLSALLLVDTAALLQDLCAVREDRAKLKVQNYIMEKELRAIQLSLQGHCLSESTLRSQLNVLQINRNLQMPKTPERVGGQQSLTQQIEKLQAAFESLRKGTEQHQAQSEELVNDLKQANAALITAFEKAKNKYLARIRKLESQVTTPMSVPKVPPTSARPPVVPAHKGGRPPLPPVSPSPTSDVYEVIQDSHVPPPNAFIPPTTWYSLNQRQDATTSNPANSYSMVKTPSFYPKHPRPGG